MYATGQSAVPSIRPVSTGLSGLLLVLGILRLVVLIGWRDGGGSTA